MPFSFTDEQSALGATVGEFLRARVPDGAPEPTDATASAGWRELWAEVCALDIPTMALPEAAGGLGLGAVELVAVAEAAGGVAAPIPLVSTTAIFAPMLARGRPLDGNAAEAAGSVAGGATGTAIVPVDESGWGRLDGDRLSLDESVVAEAGRSDWIAIPAQAAGGARLVVMRSESLPIRIVEAMDPTRPLGRLELDRHPISEAETLDGDPRLGLAIARAAVAAELVGIGAELTARSVAHAKERRQFGSPIGSFQAVKHRLVDAHVAVERARSLTYRAAVKLDRADADDARDAVRHSHLAKGAASEAATAAARTAVQVHGGIGITAEHQVSRLYLRGRQASAWLGGPEAHYAAAAALRRPLTRPSFRRAT